ncbi:hypothetical protein E4U43_004239 [Claviceps pusilla]|uniref:Uncharacterized protein n=1 Tax=Claviceps pusilla TaxID=123648 RepID=A0A9P7NH99_9HYPO|nr:hypothetical protein E4U43_004239 [Claviceps pusilla]
MSLPENRDASNEALLPVIDPAIGEEGEQRQGQEEEKTSPVAPPTRSHALAQDNAGEMNLQEPQPQQQHHAAQQPAEHTAADAQDKPTAWTTDESAAQTWPVLSNLTNQQLWALIRRFNRQVFAVRTIDNTPGPLTAMDMNVGVVDDLSPERLRAHIERLYMTVLVSLYASYKHVVRLRSWREKQRTMLFLVGYAVAWQTRTLMAAMTAFVMILIVYPPARAWCFPPAPPSLIDADTGGVKSPLSGELASDSVTGAAEMHPGEAVEQEAHNFMKSITELVMTIGAGQHPQGDPHETYKDDVLNPSSIVHGVADARDKTEGLPTGRNGGGREEEEADETKRPISQAVEHYQVLPLMQRLPELVDTWERFENALSPTSPPFPRHRHRLVLAACLVPLLLVSCCVSSQTMVHGLGFINGVMFFGKPAIRFVGTWLDERIPDWKRYIELRHTILRGVPTNAQLTLTILRMGEARGCPVPPPPTREQPGSAEGHVDTSELDQIGAPHQDIQEAIEPDARSESQPSTHSENADAKDSEDGKSKTVRRVANAIKRTTRSGVKILLKIDQARASLGQEDATNRLGALQEEPGRVQDAGPVRFPARYQGVKGYAFIMTNKASSKASSKAASPALRWRSLTAGDTVTGGTSEEAGPTAWTVSLSEIGEMRKMGGLGWKSKAVVGGVLGWRVTDGLVVTMRDGTERHLTAVTRRDELFNRLVALGGHKWEMV